MEERPLVLAVIDAYLLLELCGGDEIDPGTAARATGEIRAQLTRLRHDDQVELRAQLAEVADDADDPGYARFVCDIADRVGLAHPRAGAHLSWR